MASDVDICRAALAALGTRQTITSIDEKSTEARACKAWYDLTLDGLQRSADFNFTRRKVALAQVDEDAPDGWRYSYSVPAQCLKVHVLSASMITYIPPVNDAIKQLKIIPVDYEVAAVDSGGRIYCNLSPVYCVFAQRVTTVDSWDVGFRNAMVMSLAAAIAFPITQKSSIATVLAQKAKDALSEALASDGNEANQNYMEHVPDWIAAR